MTQELRTTVVKDDPLFRQVIDSVLELDGTRCKVASISRVTDKVRHGFEHAGRHCTRFYSNEQSARLAMATVTERRIDAGFTLLEDSANTLQRVADLKARRALRVKNQKKRTFRRIESGIQPAVEVWF